jgi:hypothetical protein
VPVQQVGDDEVGVDDAGDRHPAAGDLLHHEGVGEQGLAEAAVLGVDGQAEDAEALQALDDLRRIRVLVVKLSRYRDDLRVDELADRTEDVDLKLGKAVGVGQAVHGCGTSSATLQQALIV